MSKLYELDTKDLAIKLDPHHGSCGRWVYLYGEFYYQYGRCKGWQKVKRIHATRARILMLADLVKRDNRIYEDSEEDWRVT